MYVSGIFAPPRRGRGPQLCCGRGPLEYMVSKLSAALLLLHLLLHLLSLLELLLPL